MIRFEWTDAQQQPRTLELQLPQGYTEGRRANFARLNALGTGQALAVYQSSTTEINLDDIRLYSVDGVETGQALTALREIATPLKSTNALPLLKVTWGNLVLPRAYLENLQIQVTRRVNLLPVDAVVTLTLILAPEAPKPVKPAEPKLTEREQADYQKKVDAAIAASPALKKKYPRAKVSRGGNVEVDGKKVASLADLGISVRPGLKP